MRTHAYRRSGAIASIPQSYVQYQRLSPSARSRLYVEPVIITGALLAESASVVDNKLNITGGVISACHVGPERAAQATLVVLIQPEPTDRDPKINLEITGPSGTSESAQLDVPPTSLGGEVGFVYFPMQMPLPQDGRYVLAVSSDNGAVALPLNVSS